MPIAQRVEERRDDGTDGAMSRVKVFFLIPSLVQGGAERQILELIARLPERFEPVLALWRDEIHYRDHLPAGQPRYILGTRRMNRRGLLVSDERCR